MLEGELLRAKQKFDGLDTDSSGLLAGPELEQLSKWLFESFHPGGEALHAEVQAAQVAKLLQRLDDNNDGALSFEEFSVWFKKTCIDINRFRRAQAHRA